MNLLVFSFMASGFCVMVSRPFLQDIKQSSHVFCLEFLWLNFFLIYAGIVCLTVAFFQLYWSKIDKIIVFKVCKIIFFLFFFLAASTEYGSSQGRDQIRAATATYARTAAMPNPFFFFFFFFFFLFFFSPTCLIYSSSLGCQ